MGMSQSYGPNPGDRQAKTGSLTDGDLAGAPGGRDYRTAKAGTWGVAATGAHLFPPELEQLLGPGWLSSR